MSLHVCSHRAYSAVYMYMLLAQESFHTRNAITYIKTHEAVAKLRENLRAEHNVTIEFCAAVFKGVSSGRLEGYICCFSWITIPAAVDACWM